MTAASNARERSLMTWVTLRQCVADGGRSSAVPTVVTAGARHHTWGTPVYATSSESSPNIDRAGRAGRKRPPSSGITSLPASLADHDHRRVTGTQAAWWVEGEHTEVTLRVINDRWGMAPAYWWAEDHGIVVADRVDDLLTQVARLPEFRGFALDTFAAAATLELGQPVGDTTLFSGVHALPAASTLRWRPGRPVDIAVQPDDPPSPTSASRDQQIDTFLDAFEAAVSRRRPTDGPVILPLSGGADSRHILLELVAQGAHVDGIVTAATHRGDPELKVAAIIAKRLGITHRVVHHPIGSLASERRNNAVTNYQASELAWYLTVVDHLRTAAATTYDGIGGDVLSAGLYQSPARVAAVRRGNWRGLAEHLTGGSRHRDRFTPKVVAGVLPARDEIIDHLAEVWRSHADEPNPLAWGMFTTRTRRHISMAPMAQLDGLTVHTPYLDDDVVTVLRARPMTDPVDHMFHRDAIARRFPAFADVPYEDDQSTPWQDVRAGARRRIATVRLMSQAGDIFVGGALARAASVPSARFKSFKEVRRAIVVHQAAGRISQLNAGGSGGL